MLVPDLSVKAAVRKAQQKAGQHSQISVWFWNKEEERITEIVVRSQELGVKIHVAINMRK
jgi:hypothetical protein